MTIINDLKILYRFFPMAIANSYYSLHQDRLDLSDG